MCWVDRKPKTTVVFTMFFASGSKKYGIYSGFWPAPTKTLVFTDASPYNKMWFLDPKRTKTL